jgi:hypothetical protein
MKNREQRMTVINFEKNAGKNCYNEAWSPKRVAVGKADAWMSASQQCRNGHTDEADAPKQHSFLFLMSWIGRSTAARWHVRESWEWREQSQSDDTSVMPPAESDLPT